MTKRAGLTLRLVSVQLSPPRSQTPLGWPSAADGVAHPGDAAADLGVAMGRGDSDLALHSADALLVRDDLATRPAAITLSRRARRLVKVNLIIAGTFGLLGPLRPPRPAPRRGRARGLHRIVGLNNLRLLAPSAWRRATTERTP